MLYVVEVVILSVER